MCVSPGPRKPETPLQECINVCNRASGGRAKLGKIDYVVYLQEAKCDYEVYYCVCKARS